MPWKKIFEGMSTNNPEAPSFYIKPKTHKERIPV